MTESRNEGRMALEEQLRMRRFAKLGSFIDVVSGVAGPTARIVALRARGNSRVEIHRVQRDGSLFRGGYSRGS